MRTTLDEIAQKLYRRTESTDMDEFRCCDEQNRRITVKTQCCHMYRAILNSKLHQEFQNCSALASMSPAQKFVKALGVSPPSLP